MRVFEINLSEQPCPLGFSEASRIADALAEAVHGETTCISWYDRDRDHECPAHASECHDDSCEIPGYVEYAISRGSDLRVRFEGGRFDFLYVAMGDFGAEH